MARYVGFVRAVMVGREGLHRDRLLESFHRAGGAEPVSYISTGNVAFDCRPDELDTVRGRAEAALGEIVGRPTPVFVRRVADLARLAASDPFAAQPFGDEVVDRVVTFGERRFRRLPAGGLWSARRDVVVYATSGRDAFGVTRLVDGSTGAPGGMLERHHGAPLTSRAWSTIERIVRLETR